MPRKRRQEASEFNGGALIKDSSDGLVRVDKVSTLGASATQDKISQPQKRLKGNPRTSKKSTKGLSGAVAMMEAQEQQMEALQSRFHDKTMSSRAEYLDLLRETLGAIQYDFHSHTQANPGPEDLRKGHLSLIANVAKITTTIQALAKERQRHVSSVTTEETMWGEKVKDISTQLHDKGQKVGGQIAIALSGKGDPDDPFWQDITNPDLNPTVENTASIDLLSWADTVEKQERGVKKLVRALPRCDEHI